MEFTKDIEFSKKLKENEESTITYKGYLYQKNSQEVTMVYGYGDSWDNTSNALMAKTDHGFEATIKLASNYDTFNFCFKNENNEWDNNYGYNFISPIVPSFVSPLAITGILYSSVLVSEKDLGLSPPAYMSNAIFFNSIHLHSFGISKG